MADQWGGVPVEDTGQTDQWGGVLVAETPKPSEPESWMPRALSEAHPEGAKAFSEALGNINYLNPFRADVEQDLQKRAESGFLEGSLESFTKTGKALASAAGLPFAYPMGAARSIVGHPMASIVELVGKGVEKLTGRPAPSHEQIYEKLAPDIDVIWSGLAPRPGVGAPRVVPPKSGFVRDTARLATEGGQETLAGQAMERAISGAGGDPAAVRTTLESPPPDIVPGSPATTYQLTGDPGLGALERGVSRATPEAAARFNELRGQQNAARLKALEEAQQSGSPEAVAEHLRTGMREADYASEQALQQAETRAWQTANELGGANDPQIYGNVVRRELQMAEEQARRQEQALWNAVDPDGSLVARTGPVKEVNRNIYENLTQAAQTTVIPSERAINELITGYGPSISFREMTDLRSAVSRAMREERMANGQSPAYRRLVQLRTGLENAIVNDVMDVTTQQFAAAAAERLRVASEATRERAQRFGAQPIKGILQREGLEGPYRMQEGAVPGKLITPGPAGYDNTSAFLRAVGNQEGVPVVRDAAVASMRRAAMNPDGTINPDRLARWMERHQDVLRAIDERDGGNLSQALRNAETAQRAVGEAAAVRRRVLDEYQDGVVAKLIGAVDKQDINRIVGRVLNSDRAVADMRDLSRRMTTSEARDGLRRSIAEYIREKFISNTEAATTEQNLIRADQFQQFMKTKRAALEQAGFTPEQLNAWQAIADDIHRANRSISSNKIPGGSDTVQNLMAVSRFGQKMSLLGRIVAYAIGGGTGYASGGLSWLAGLLGAHIVVGLRESGIASVNELVTRAMLDPVLARQLLQKAAGKERVPALKYYGMFQAGAPRRENE